MDRIHTRLNINGLNKRQVRLLAKTLGAPELLITKAPTADLEDLAPGKTDEDALGLGYDQLDDFLEGQPVAAEVSQLIIDTFLKTQHKRHKIAGTIAPFGKKSDYIFSRVVGTNNQRSY
jgi:NAD+ synthetase